VDANASSGLLHLPTFPPAQTRKRCAVSCSRREILIYIYVYIHIAKMGMYIDLYFFYIYKQIYIYTHTFIGLFIYVSYI
jgi:hypothetical protein